MYLIETLKILTSACILSVSVNEFQNDEDTLQYLSELRDHLVECYTTLTQGVKDSNSQQLYLEYMPGLFQFLMSHAGLNNNLTTYL